MRPIDADSFKLTINTDKFAGFLMTQIIDMQPTIDLKPQWIPVTESLPDEKQAVLMLLRNGNVFSGEIRQRQSLPEWWYYYDPSDNDMDMLGIHFYVDGFLRDNSVVAWMPMPEPYEEER